MNLIDWRLFILSLLFLLFFSPIYAWGMLKWFYSTSDKSILKWNRDKKRFTIQKPPYRFSWSIASVIGIASVVSMSYVAGLLSLQDVFNLAVVFLAALPGMIFVDMQLKKNLTNKIQELKNQIKVLTTLLDMYEKATGKLKGDEIEEVEKVREN